MGGRESVCRWQSTNLRFSGSNTHLKFAGMARLLSVLVTSQRLTDIACRFRITTWQASVSFTLFGELHREKTDFIRLND